MAEECGFCAEAGSVLYRWTCPGCRARMLAELPNREARAGWIKHWRFKGETAMADAVIAKLREMADANNSNK